MAFYKELNDIAYSIITEKFLRSQNICKLLTCFPKYSDDNNKIFQSSRYSVFDNPDLDDTSPLYMTSIYPLPKMPDAKTEQKMYLTLTISGGYEPDKNSGFRRVNLLIDIVCHTDCWCVKEGYRPYLMMNEIDMLLNNQMTDLPIEGVPYSRGYQPRDYSNYFYGFQLLYELWINSNVECNPTPKHEAMKNTYNFMPRVIKSHG